MLNCNLQFKIILSIVDCSILHKNIFTILGAIVGFYFIQEVYQDTTSPTHLSPFSIIAYLIIKYEPFGLLLSFFTTCWYLQMLYLKNVSFKLLILTHFPRILGTYSYIPTIYVDSVMRTMDKIINRIIYR